jgi:tripartite-type tricarboxylate transporter receptor subunit TctC
MPALEVRTMIANRWIRSLALGLTTTIAVAFAAATPSTRGAAAEVYPSRPITLVVPFAAGGPSDTVARILSERMRVSLGQSIVIENVVGAAGSLAVGRVVRAAPDGYTLSFGHWSTHVVNGAVYPLQYDLLQDLQPISLLPSNPMLIVAKNAVPAKDLQELIAWLKANEDKASAGTSGPGSGSHIAALYFQQVTGTRFRFVPYRGTGPALQDLIAGHIDLVVDQVSNSLPHARDGVIKAFAVTAQSRLASAPHIPTVDEAGAPGLHMTIWYGLWAPKSTPQHVVARINTVVMEALADPTVRQRFTDLGLDVPPRSQQTPEALAVHHKAEVEKWWPLIKAANITVN